MIKSDNITLESESIILSALSVEHRDGLINAASDGKLWQLWYTNVPSADNVSDYIATALKQKNEGCSLPFVVFHKPTNKIIGSTRYCNIDSINRRLEIGYTWYAKSYQRSSVNTECKMQLLSYAFEKLNCIAVEFRTHWHNQPSRAAIARLGAKQDGVLRNHKIHGDGSLRDTVVFSILNTEWPAVKKNLIYKLKSLQLLT